jgi:hypothetical protein
MSISWRNNKKILHGFVWGNLKKWQKKTPPGGGDKKMK